MGTPSLWTHIGRMQARGSQARAGWLDSSHWARLRFSRCLSWQLLIMFSSDGRSFLWSDRSGACKRESTKSEQAGHTALTGHGGVPFWCDSADAHGVFSREVCFSLIRTNLAHASGRKSSSRGLGRFLLLAKAENFLFCDLTGARVLFPVWETLLVSWSALGFCPWGCVLIAYDFLASYSTLELGVCHDSSRQGTQVSSFGFCISRLGQACG